jgi:hypothetical protein
MTQKAPTCPFLKKPCIEHECMMYTHLTMINPQTGVSQDQWGCAVQWLPILLVENAKQGRGVQAAVEDTRNQIVKRQEEFNDMARLARSRQSPLTLEDLES